MVLAVASTSCRLMDLFATDTWEHLGRISEMVAEPHEITSDESRRLLYVAHTYRSGGYQSDTATGHEISVVEVDRPAVVDVIDIHPFISPHDIEYSPANDLIYASIEGNDAGNGIVIVDPGARAVVGHIATPARNSHWLAVSPDGARAYVSHKEAPFISVIDLHRRETAATVELPGGAEEIDIAADGKAVFVVTPLKTPRPILGPGPSSVVKIDVASNEIVGAVELDPTVVAVRTTVDGKVLASQMYPGDDPHVVELFSGERGGVEGKLHIIDGGTMTLLNTIDLERMSFTIRVSPDGSTAYVANAGSGTLSVVDLGRGEVVRSLDCTPNDQFGGTHGMSLISAA